MRKAIDGSTLFKTTEYLTPCQISSFFSLLAKKKPLPAHRDLHNVGEEEEENNDIDDDYPTEMERLRTAYLHQGELYAVYLCMYT